MLTIVHGSDTAGSRKFFLDEKKRMADAVLLRESEVSLTFLAQLLEGGGLFENSKNLFIEQFLTERKKSKEKEAITAYFLQQGKAHNIFLWEGKELTAAALTPLKGSIIRAFKLPISLFAFLDALRPGNGRQLIQLFHKSLETTEPEMVFFMLVRQFRLLLALSDPSSETISEVSRLAPWQKGKMEKQAKLFPTVKLKVIYSRLFEIEIAQKTGMLTQSLISVVDFLLIGI